MLQLVHTHVGGVGRCGIPGAAQGLSRPNPALARGGERSRARPSPPVRCVTHRHANRRLPPAPCRGNDLPPLPSISGSLSRCLINMHYAQPIKAGAVLSLRIAA